MEIPATAYYSKFFKPYTAEPELVSGVLFTCKNTFIHFIEVTMQFHFTSFYTKCINPRYGQSWKPIKNRHRTQSCWLSLKISHREQLTNLKIQDLLKVGRFLEQVKFYTCWMILNPDHSLSGLQDLSIIMIIWKKNWMIRYSKNHYCLKL